MKNSPDSLDSEEEDINVAEKPKGAQGAQTARYDPDKNFFNKTQGLRQNLQNYMGDSANN